MHSIKADSFYYLMRKHAHELQWKHIYWINPCDFATTVDVIRCQFHCTASQIPEPKFAIRMIWYFDLPERSHSFMRQEKRAIVASPISTASFLLQMFCANSPGSHVFSW